MRTISRWTMFSVNYVFCEQCQVPSDQVQFRGLHMLGLANIGYDSEMSSGI